MKKRLYILFFTFFGIGFFPIGQGTVASIVSATALYFINTYFQILFITILALIFIFLAHKINEIWQERDPHYVVADEVIGMGLSIIFLPKEVEYFLLSFAIFRLIDILKIPPVNIFDKMESPYGILLDDVVGGIITNIVMQALIRML